MREHGQEETRLTALWGVVVLCTCAAVTLPSFRSPWGMLVVAVLAWTALARYLARATRMGASLAWFAPLALLYYSTFRLERWRGTSALESYFGAFGTDTGRLLGLASRWGVEERHAGFSLLAFVFHPAQALGERIGLERLGPEVLFLQSALLGALSSALVFHWLGERVASRQIRLLVAYCFGGALVTWAIASAIDTYVVSLFLFLVLLLEAREYEAGRRRLPVLLGLVTATMLAISLENVYAPAVVAWCLASRPRAGERRVRPLLLYGATVAAAGGLLLLALQLGPGVAPGRAGERVTSFVGEHASLRRLVSPQALLQVAQSELVTGIVAQPSSQFSTYRAVVRELSWPTVAYLALAVASLALALPAARGSVRWRAWTPRLLGGTYVLRQASMMVWVPRESLVFVGPSVAVLALLAGCGAAALERRGDRRRMLAYRVVLALLAVLLLSHNGYRLFTTDVPRQP